MRKVTRAERQENSAADRRDYRWAQLKKMTEEQRKQFELIHLIYRRAALHCANLELTESGACLTNLCITINAEDGRASGVAIDERGMLTFFDNDGRELLRGAKLISSCD